MDTVTIIILVFALLGALDRVLGNKFGVGKEFEQGFMLLGTMALTMIGMIVISPLIADLMGPVSGFVSEKLHIDPSIIPASLFANDMGGAPLAVEMTQSEKLGLYNALVVSSMMGCTVSFTIPFALGMVKREQHRELLLGLLCGIVTIPVGCFVSGLVYGLPIVVLIVDILPLLLFSLIIALGLIFLPDLCVKIFAVFGVFIKILITVGLALGITEFLLDREIIKRLATFEEGVMVCANAAVVLAGAFPFMCIVSKLLKKPLNAVGRRIGIDEYSTLGIISSIVTSATAFGMMDRMNKKGTMLNSAFAVSGAFVLGSHLAFTLAFDASMLVPVLLGKVVSGIASLGVANIIFNKIYRSKEVQ